MMSAEPANRTGGPQTAPSEAAASSEDTISNYVGNQRRPDGMPANNKHDDDDGRRYQFCKPVRGSSGQPEARHDRAAANGVRSAHIVAHHSGAAATNLTDGPVPASSSDAALSSGADLNCRHLIRSPVAAAAAAKASVGQPVLRELEIEYCSPLTSSSDRIRRQARKQETSASGGCGGCDGYDGASDRQSIFKRAASGLSTTRRLLPSLGSASSSGSRRQRDTTNNDLVRVRANLVGLACGSIKSDQQLERHNLHRWRLDKTIKTFVASGGSNWSRFNSQQQRPQEKPNEPINVAAPKDHIQAKKEVKKKRKKKKLEEAKQQENKSIKSEDADSLRSDAIVLSSSSSSSSPPPLQVYSFVDRQQKAIKSLLLRNSLSCELSFLCPQDERTVSEQKSSSKTKLVVNESNNIVKQIRQSSEQLAAQTTSTRTARRRRKKRRLSSVERIKLQSSSIDSSINMSGNLATNKYIIEDGKKRRQRQIDEVDNNRQSFFDDRRSTVCSSTVGGITSDMIHDDYDSCDFSSSIAAAAATTNNNNSLVGDMTNRLGGAQEDPDDNRQGNSNDCNNPSQGQSALVNIIIIKDNNNNKHSKGGGRPAGGNGGGPSAGGPSNNQATVSGLKERENWSMNIEFLLAVIGFAVDLGNIWRFPYICYRNGGGAFLIPYTIMFILGGLPIFYLEMSLGQYFSSGCLTVWRRVCPMAKGIGYAMCVLNFFTGLYYNTIISWAVFFFVESFTTILPWTSCNNSWNTVDCKTIDQRQALKSLAYNSTVPLSSPKQSIFNDSSYSSPTKDYFEREVLQVHLSTGIDDLGSIRRPLAIYLAIVFVCIYFAIWKGVKSTGKAVWITALLPYFVLIPLLIRGVFLEGAWLGIRYYLEPQWVRIFDVNVWVEAAKQIYFSLGPGFGTLMALSSYNKFHHNCRRDAFIAASVNYFASFIAGLVVFALLGYMATIMDVSINDVATEGPGLVFQVYPEGLATMRFSAMWSVLFFIMVITLGIDSTFGGLESVITGLCDEYPRVLRAHRGTFIGFLIVLIYFCSLPTTTYGGNYVIYLLESYGTSLSLIFIVLVETIVVCWIYGTDRFCSNLEEMYGERPGPFWRICWKYISPTILLLIFLAACGQEFDKYHILNNGDYVYPSWAPFLGLLMTGSSVCCIPIYAIYYIKTKTSGTLWERLKIAIRPEGDLKVAEKDIYGDTMVDKTHDENDIHMNAAI